MKWNSAIGGGLCTNSNNFELFKLPGFNIKRFPFVLMRDDNAIRLFNVVSKRLIFLKDAFFGNQSGYKTMDLITSPDNGSEFEVVYLVTGE